MDPWADPWRDNSGTEVLDDEVRKEVFDFHVKTSTVIVHSLGEVKGEGSTTWENSGWGSPWSENKPIRLTEDDKGATEWINTKPLGVDYIEESESEISTPASTFVEDVVLESPAPVHPRPTTPTWVIDDSSDHSPVASDDEWGLSPVSTKDTAGEDKQLPGLVGLGISFNPVELQSTESTSNVSTPAVSTSAPTPEIVQTNKVSKVAQRSLFKRMFSGFGSKKTQPSQEDVSAPSPSSAVHTVQNSPKLGLSDVPRDTVNEEVAEEPSYFPLPTDHSTIAHIHDTQLDSRTPNFPDCEISTDAEIKPPPVVIPQFEFSWSSHVVPTSSVEHAAPFERTCEQDTLHPPEAILPSSNEFNLTRESFPVVTLPTNDETIAELDIKPPPIHIPQFQFSWSSDAVPLPTSEDASHPRPIEQLERFETLKSDILPVVDNWDFPPFGRRDTQTTKEVLVIPCIAPPPVASMKMNTPEEEVEDEWGDMVGASGIESESVPEIQILSEIITTEEATTPEEIIDIEPHSGVKATEMTKLEILPKEEPKTTVNPMKRKDSASNLVNESTERENRKLQLSLEVESESLRFIRSLSSFDYMLR